MNANPSCPAVPVEVECMADYRPFWKGKWRLRLFRPDGSEVPCQEEQPEALLPFNGWRRKICFMADLPGVGVSHYEARAFKEKRGERGDAAPVKKKGSDGVDPRLNFRIDPHTGLVTSLTAGGSNYLAGTLMQPLVIDDNADSWGTERGNYRNIKGVFKQHGTPRRIEDGPIRSITESVFVHKKSRIVMETISTAAGAPGFARGSTSAVLARGYKPRASGEPKARPLTSAWPALEFRLRIVWNEERRRLKLSIPTVFKPPSVLAEIPGGAIARPADGQEHVHGRWLLVEGKLDGKDAALGVVSSGQNGFDFADGEIRLSVLRSAAYCHERGFKIGRAPARKLADLGVHDVRLLVTAGEPERIRRMLPGLADWLSAPPFAIVHLPIGATKSPLEILSVEPQNIRLTACKRSWDGKALVVRLHEAAGIETQGRLSIQPSEKISLKFKPFEIKTVRLERSGRWREADLIEES
ncbi:MAG: glycoside hydrolase family 38 C-terminal domain-containing protein [Candidatus Aminicenantes bacterium]|nr:glycoside hydrolase family 38 C-terminal domain-containing protein [Candidatus Aminicenantes bacterium]